MISRTLLILALAGALTGCDSSVEAARRENDVVRAPSASSIARRVNTSRGRLLAGERVERTPTWPPVSTIAAMRGRLPAALIVEIDRSPVPVLLPHDENWLARARLFTAGPQGAGYTFVASLDGLHLSVQASRLALLLPHVGQHRGKHQIRGTVGFIGENEGIHAASWIENGVAYNAELECLEPDGPECVRERLAALVDKLEYVGGALATGGES